MRSCVTTMVCWVSSRPLRTSSRWPQCSRVLWARSNWTGVRRNWRNAGPRSCSSTIRWWLSRMWRRRTTDCIRCWRSIAIRCSTWCPATGTNGMTLHARSGRGTMWWGPPGTMRMLTCWSRPTRRISRTVSSIWIWWTGPRTTASPIKPDFCRTLRRSEPECECRRSSCGCCISRWASAGRRRAARSPSG